MNQTELRAMKLLLLAPPGFRYEVQNPALTHQLRYKIVRQALFHYGLAPALFERSGFAYEVDRIVVLLECATWPEVINGETVLRAS